MDEICEVLDDFENEDLRSKSRAIARAIVNNAKTSAASPTVTFNRIYQNLKRKSNKFLFTALIENQIKVIGLILNEKQKFSDSLATCNDCCRTRP